MWLQFRWKKNCLCTDWNRKKKSTGFVYWLYIKIGCQTSSSTIPKMEIYSPIVITNYHRLKECAFVPTPRNYFFLFSLLSQWPFLVLLRDLATFQWYHIYSVSTRRIIITQKKIQISQNRYTTQNQSGINGRIFWKRKQKFDWQKILNKIPFHSQFSLLLFFFLSFPFWWESFLFLLWISHFILSFQQFCYLLF